MEEVDFLWECALIKSDSNSTHFMVPGILDEPKNFLKREKNATLQNYSIYPPCRVEEYPKCHPLSISVTEIRGNGVLDTIGGEIWEACLLLSAYILLYPKSFMKSSVLELGSGLGLPGLLVAELQSYVNSQVRREVCLSDNDPRCVESLVQLIQTRYNNTVYEDRAIISEDSDEIEGRISRSKLSVIDLDWSFYVPISRSATNITEDFDSFQQEALNVLSNAEHLKAEDTLVNENRFQILMGSALCYSPYHICLADTLKHFLDGACEEIIIIQIGDRAGFSLMLDRLSFLQIEYTIEEVSEEIYDAAQLIGQNQSISLDTASASMAHNSCLFVAPSYDEGEVRTKKKFHFPTKLVQSAIAACRAVTVDTRAVSCNYSGDPDISTILPSASDIVVTDQISVDTTHSIPVLSDSTTRNLIKTDRESFKILKIKK